MNRDNELSAEIVPAPLADRSSIEHAQAVVRAIESAGQVRRRYQFFVWLQSYLHALLPHQLAVCGAYQRTRKDIAFEVFNSIPVPSPLLSSVTDGGSALMQQVIGGWIDRRGRSLVVDMHALTGIAAGSEREHLLDSGFEQLLVHGVSRPQRPAELESLFIFGSTQARWSEAHAEILDLLLPYVHRAWLCVQATERELSGAANGNAPLRADSSRSLITERENQILFWVREGKSNHEIGEQLGISVLTVKNHVQKILRKLGAANRAQAVAKAMTLNLLGRHGAGPGAAETH